MTVDDDKALIVVVDTTAFVTDLTLSRIAWQQILSLSSREHIRLWIPEIVVLEAARHQQQAVAKQLAETRKAFRNFYRRTTKAAKQIADTEMHDRIETIIEGQNSILDWFERINAHHEQRLRARLIDNEGEILPIPKISHEALVTRALEERKPFRTKGDDNSGKKGADGYRDALVWASIVEAAQDLNDGDGLYVVTGNAWDFCLKGKSDTLHPDLINDLAVQLQVRRYENLEKLLPDLPIAPIASQLTSDWLETAFNFPLDQPRLLPALQEAIKLACDDLAGERIDELDDDKFSSDLQFNFPLPFETEAKIVAVSPNLNSITWAIHDGVDDGIAVAQITVDAVATFEGPIYKADFMGNDDSDIEVYDWDHNRHYLWAEISPDVCLTFDAEIDTDTEKIDLTFNNGSHIASNDRPGSTRG